MQFDALYWDISDLDDSPDGDKLKAFFKSKKPDIKIMELLLQSDSTPAQCIAIEQYCSAESESRFGFINQFESLLDLVKKRIIEQLEDNPYVKKHSENDTMIGANHASAFHALSVISLNCGSKLLTQALMKNTDSEVISEGISAAGLVVLRGDKNPCPKLMEILKNIASSQESHYELRCDAMLALCVVATDKFEPFILEMTNDQDIKVSSTAARLLAERNLEKYRPILKKLAYSWSAMSDYHELDELVDILEGNK